MSGIELVGLVLGIWPLLSSVARELDSDWKDFGLVPAIILRIGLFEARSTVDQIRNSFIIGNSSLDQAIAFKDSYAPGLNMIGVAGAIIAQIALTALGLPDLDQTHWTAQAAFVIGLVSGSFAVFYSCVLQRQLSSLHDAYAVRRWLTRPRETWQSFKMAASWPSKNADQEQHPSDDAGLRLEDLRRSINQLNETVNEQFYRPSLCAALILTAPSQLLNIALGSLLAGFGIYFGVVWSSALPGVQGHSAALATLATYIAFTVFALLLYYGPMLVKILSQMRDNGNANDTMTRIQNLAEDLLQREAKHAADQRSAFGTTLESAGFEGRLNRIIALQEQQLSLQSDLLRAISPSGLTPAARDAVASPIESHTAVRAHCNSKLIYEHSNSNMFIQEASGPDQGLITSMTALYDRSR